MPRSAHQPWVLVLADGDGFARARTVWDATHNSGAATAGVHGSPATLEQTRQWMMTSAVAHASSGSAGSVSRIVA